MSHYDAHHDHTPGLSGVHGLAQGDERPDVARSAADSDSELTELRRNLLLYGTAGEAARPRVEAPAA